MDNEKINKGKVAIVGCGIVGTNWATIFASSGYEVCIYDIDEKKIESTLKVIFNKLRILEVDHLLRGPGSAVDQYHHVHGTIDLNECLRGAIYCQESISENVAMKHELFLKLDKAASGDTVVLASSTSTIPSSKFTESMRRRSQCLVVHPINPPLYLSLTEIVPATWTKPEIVNEACRIMKDIGQTPVRLNKEIPGFAVNRLQYSLIAEAWRLVNDCIMSPEDVDKVMKDGLGPRYAFYGPFEVMHMNANGIGDYLQRYGGAIVEVLKDFGPIPNFSDQKTTKFLSDAMNKTIPTSKFLEGIQQRERKLSDLCRLKKKLNNELKNSN